MPISKPLQTIGVASPGASRLEASRCWVTLYSRSWLSGLNDPADDREELRFLPHQLAPGQRGEESPEVSSSAAKLEK